MVFSSVLFLFLFLPIVLGIYHGLLPLVTPAGHIRLKTRNLFLLASSLIFYAWGEQFLIFIMIASLTVNYISGRLIAGVRRDEPLDKDTPRTAVQKAALVVSICVNLGVLGFYKYFNFGVDNFMAVCNSMGLDWLHPGDIARVALPLGISFYTFQAMSYTIDVYRGETAATKSFFDMACFVTLFPQLVAGPIVRYRDIVRQLADRTVNRPLFASGLARFVMGLGKKVLIANTVALPADQIFAVPASQLTTPMAWLGVLCYTLQIYFDFSGYSDMAIGLGRMFGFKYLENFNYPYISRSIRDFWRRWHISLSTWFRDYLYVPLGGNRVSKGRTYVNMVIVFLLCGLWHGASWTFIVWGLYHGFFLVIERTGLERRLATLWRPLQHGYTLLVVMMGWVLFRSETFAQALSFAGAMTGFGRGAGHVQTVGLYLRPDVVVAIIAGIVLSTPVVRWGWQGFQRQLATIKQPQALEIAGAGARLAVLAAILLASILSLSSGTHNPFIYFRF